MPKNTEKYGRDKNGKFTEGNPGKPQGAKSEKTKQWELLSEKITDKYTKRVYDYLDSIEDNKEFFNAYLSLIEYFKPKLNRTDLKTDNSEINVNVLSGLSFEQLYELRYGKKPDR